MKKITLFLAFILTLSITAIILSSCSKNTSSLTSPQPTVTITSTVTAPLSSSQPPVTITSTQTMTMSATQTVPVASATPDIPQNVDKNTPRFLVGRDTFADLNLIGCV